MVERQYLSEQLDRLEQLSQGPKWKRFAKNPLKYLLATVIAKSVFPSLKWSQHTSVQTFWGDSMHLVLPACTDIYLLGGKGHDSEIRLCRYLLNHLDSGDLFFDIGVHYGFFSLLGARLVGSKGRVMAFEASAQNHQVAESNLKSLSNVSLWHCAITNVDQRLIFFEFPLAYSENNTLDVSVFEQDRAFRNLKAQAIEVDGRSLSSICKEINRYPQLIKIDVEGAELQVIEGMKGLFDQRVFPDIVLEYWNNDQKNNGQINAINILQETGYTCYRILTNGQLSPVHDFRTIGQYLEEESDNLVFKHAHRSGSV